MDSKTTHYIPKFLKDVPRTYFLYPDDKKTGKPEGLGQNWSLEEASFKLKSGYHIRCDFDLTGSGIACIDVDDNKLNEQLVFELCSIDTEKTLHYEGNSKGLHIYIKCDRTNSNKVKCGVVNYDIDYLGGRVWERIDKRPLNEDFLCEVTDEQLGKLCDLDRIYNIKKPPKPNPTVTSTSVEPIIELISVKFLDDYDSWRRIVWAAKNCGVDCEFMRTISQKSTKYTDDGFDNIWKGDCLEHTEGTLRYYAKQSDEEAYYCLCPSKYLTMDIISKGSQHIAEFIAPKLKETAIYCGDKWYIYNDATCLWSVVKSPVFVLVKCFRIYLDEALGKESKKLNACDTEEEREKIRKDITNYTKQYSLLDSGKMCSQIQIHLQSIVCDEYFSKKIDANLYKLAFKNGVYDLKTNTFREGLRYDDFLSSTIPHNYEPSSSEAIDFVREVIFKICNCNETHLDYYLSIMGHAMTGDADKEKTLYYMVGLIGDNGKTLIMDVLATIMPNYVYKIDKLTFELGFSKAHKYLSRIPGKRIVYVEELSKKKQNTELLKEFGDGKTIENEVMYGTAENINITCKLFCLSNNTPNLEACGGIENRYRQLSFNSNFGKKNTTDDYDNLRFIQDNTLSDKLAGEYKMALINLLIEYAHRYTVRGLCDIPTEFKMITKDTMSLNNEFKSWFEDNCEVDPDFMCAKKEIETNYKTTMTIREMKDEIQKLGFKYDSQKKHNKCKGVFLGFRIKRED